MSKIDGENSKKQEEVVSRQVEVHTQTMTEKRLQGRLDPYIPGESFEDYLDQVECYFSLNELTDDAKKVRVLMNLMGSAASTKIMKSLKPEKYTAKSFAEIVKEGKRLFVGELNIFVERYKFNRRQQQAGETLEDFAVALQTLAESCEFEGFRDVALRDRFVAGVASTEIVQELLEQDKTISFSVMVDKARKKEVTVREAKTMVGPSQSEALEVNAVKRGSEGSRSNSPSSTSSWRSAPSNSESGKVTRCYKCTGTGHFAINCPSGRTNRFPKANSQWSAASYRGSPRFNNQAHRRRMVNCIDDFEEMDLGSGEEENATNDLNSVLGNGVNSVRTALVNLMVDSTRLTMEIDTGSCVSVCDVEDYERNFSHKRLFKHNEAALSVISGERLRTLGRTKVRVRGKNGVHELMLTVVATPKRFLPLLGRDWLDVLWPSWRDSFKVNSVGLSNREDSFRTKVVKDLKLKFPSVFNNDLTNPIKDFKVDIRMHEGFKPFVHKPYTVPFKVRDRVVAQLNQLEKAGILEKIEYASCASPMVVVAKTNNDIRMCFDGSVTINPFIETHHYPLPVIDELLANKSGAKCFCVLDLKGAYQQLIVSDATKKLLAVNTIQGLYVYKRLPFGVKPAASIFQSVMDKILEGLEQVQVYIDDILVWAETDKELYQILLRVMQRLDKFNVKLNADKCQWFVESVKYLGHVLSARGIEPNREKIKAIVEAPAPTNVSQLKALLGMVEYYAKFLPGLNVSFAPLFKLLRKDTEWLWDEACQKAFNKCKRDLSSDRLLTHYDQRLPMILTCDASNDGIAGVLSHRVNGEERPVFYVSRALKPSERNYPILHREALAIVFAMEKLYKYVFGHKVTIFTDHKPLEGVFNGKKGAPPVIASRLQRYFWRLAHFDYTVRYKKGSENGNADCLSRLPIVDAMSEADRREMLGGKVNAVELKNEWLKMSDIRHATNGDSDLKKVREYVTNGWSCDADKRGYKAFYTNRQLLDVNKGCLTYDERVVIPKALQQQVLKVLHLNHAGIVRMKQLARKSVFWSGLNEDIERYVNRCESCQVLRKDKPNKEYGVWASAVQPFDRIHIDFFHFQSNTFLIVVDAYSRWLEIKRMNRTTASALINVLSEIFSVFGFPKEIVSDNGPPYTSFELSEFYRERNITQTHTPPYHPASNGLVERAVQTAKSVLRKVANDRSDKLQIDKAVEDFLFTYRNSPHTSKQLIPAHLMLNFRPRSPLNLLNDNIKSSRVSFAQDTRIDRVQTRSPTPSITFVPRESVLYLTKHRGYCYSLKARVIKKMSNTVYQIAIDGSVKLAHINQLRKSILKKSLDHNTPAAATSTQQSPAMSIPSSITTPIGPKIARASPKQRESEPESEYSTASEDGSGNESITIPLALRRTPRTKKNISRYRDENY